MTIQHEYLEKLRLDVIDAQAKVDHFIYLLGKFPDLKVEKGVLTSSDISHTNWCERDSLHEFSFWHNTACNVHGNVLLLRVVDKELGWSSNGLRNALFDIAYNAGNSSNVGCDDFAERWFKKLIGVEIGRGYDLDP